MNTLPPSLLAVLEAQQNALRNIKPEATYEPHFGQYYNEARNALSTYKQEMEQKPFVVERYVVTPEGDMRVEVPETEPKLLSRERLLELCGGQEPHRWDWTADQLPDGWRPLLKGELVQEGDEFFREQEEWTRTNNHRTSYGVPSTSWLYRTQRPLPSSHSWPEVEAAFKRREKVQYCSTVFEEFSWTDFLETAGASPVFHAPTIAWRIKPIETQNALQSSKPADNDTQTPWSKLELEDLIVHVQTRAGFDLGEMTLRQQWIWGSVWERRHDTEEEMAQGEEKWATQKQAFEKEGKRIECRTLLSKGVWTDWSHVSAPNFIDDGTVEYRIAPDPSTLTSEGKGSKSYTSDPTGGPHDCGGCKEARSLREDLEWHAKQPTKTPISEDQAKAKLSELMDQCGLLFSGHNYLRFLNEFDQRSQKEVLESLFISAVRWVEGRGQ